MRIVLIGTGNVATRLGIALRARNAEIIQVFGRSETVTSQFASTLGCNFTVNIKEIATDADIYLMAVSDDAIAGLAADLHGKDGLVVHTAGSIPMEILASGSNNYGVFYPLQTLSKQKEVDFSTIPFCIEANSNENLEKLRQLASTISEKVVVMNSEQRRQIHLSAVFVCNFVNHLYSVGEQLLLDQNLDFDLLRPLIRETAEKAMLFSPPAVQTGPAVRGNKSVMDEHLKMLENHPQWHELYDLISKDIRYFQ